MVPGGLLNWWYGFPASSLDLCTRSGYAGAAPSGLPVQKAIAAGESAMKRNASPGAGWYGPVLTTLT